MFQHLNKILRQFRHCFKRKTTCKLFTVLVIGCIMRKNASGITNVVSSLRLRPSQLTDLTYIRRKDSAFTYLSTIIDAYTWQILAWAHSDSLEVDFVLETVNILFEKHGVSLDAKTLIHSDQGSHYNSYAFIDIIRDNELRQSMSRKVNCWDNAPQESFFGHMKDEIDVSGCYYTSLMLLTSIALSSV